MNSIKPQIVLPEIDMVLVRMRRNLPIKLAHLATYDKQAALSILRDWGEGVKPLRALWDDVNRDLEKYE
ncbi:hypothetical protein ACTHOQ_09460 [Solibacillus silvestris]|uniref:hypothetical protein n=1 Tax=Solibacillus silvestris TaxID=76853 RepID=UPI003F7E0462